MSIESVMPSNHLILCHLLLLPPSIFPRSFQMSQLFQSGAQSIGVSASASVLPMNKTGQSVWWLSGKESACQCKRHGIDPWSRKILHADPGRSHMPQGNQAPMPQLLSLCSRAGASTEPVCRNCWGLSTQDLCSATREATTMRSLHTTTRGASTHPTREKATQQQRPSAAKNNK